MNTKYYIDMYLLPNNCMFEIFRLLRLSLDLNSSTHQQLITGSGYVHLKGNEVETRGPRDAHRCGGWNIQPPLVCLVIRRETDRLMIAKH